MFGVKARFHVVELVFFMDENEDARTEDIAEARAVDLARLEHDIAITDDDDRAPLLDVLDGIERVGIKPVRERVVDHEVRDFQQTGIARMFDSIALESSEVVGITQFGSKLLEDFPVALLLVESDVNFEMVA